MWSEKCLSIRFIWPKSKRYILVKEMNVVLGHDSALVRLSWAGENLD